MIIFQNGMYFITIYTQNREYILGEIVNNEMTLNNAGRMAGKWLFEMEKKFKNISIDEYIIMPNHMHLIISINKIGKINKIVGADLCVCPNKPKCSNNIIINPTILIILDIMGGHTGPPLYKVVQWFKTMTTNEYIKGVRNKFYPAFNKRIWQRNYYEKIIRNESEFIKFSEYIINNPANWANDRNNADKKDDQPNCL